MKLPTTSDNLLLIFTRNPELGKCKTRLAKTLGDQKALDIYTFLLQQTANYTKPVNADKMVFYSEEIWENDIWDNQEYKKAKQKGADLGERMANAFADGFKQNYKRIIIIGSDLHNLSTHDIDDAFEHLKKHDYVIGPATDGGYYLLGMTIFDESLFINKKWSTDSVFKDSMANISTKKVKVLEPKNDVDEYEDIKDIAVFKPFLKDIII